MGRLWKKTVLLLLVWIFCAGCAAPQMAENTAPTPQSTMPRAGVPGRTGAAHLLERIWAQYEDTERFCVYGGLPEQPVMDAPGDLDMELAMHWAYRYRFPMEHLKSTDHGASLTHLMNEKLLTLAAFHMQQPEKARQLAEDWRWELQHSSWASNRPERLLLAQVEEKYLLMAYGSYAYVRLLQEKLTVAFPSSRILYQEAITV